MAGLSRNGSRLLKTVGNKPHASEDDHEDLAPPAKRRKTAAAPVKKESEDTDINAEPQASSDEELGLPPPRPVKSSMAAAIPRRSSIEDLKLNKTQRKSSRKTTSIRPPTTGVYQKGQAHKGKGAEDDKENAPSSSTGSGPIAWGMEYGSQDNGKSARGYGTKTKNIHAPPPKKYGGASKQTYGSANGSRNKQPASGTGNDSDLSSTLSEDELDMLKDMEDADSLSMPQRKTKRSTTQASNSNPTLLDEDDLSDTPGTQFKDPLARTTKKAAAKSAETLNKLNKWKENQEPPSSQPHSSAPQEDLDDVSNYVNALPVVEEEGSRCTLCSKHVDPEDYWDFWKGKKKTVKNKTAFCNVHQKITAQKEYTKAGYPALDWTVLSRRLRRHRSVLSNILNNTNKQPSIHRDRYMPLALTRKAAAVPPRRNDLSKDQQEELNSYALDDTAAYPGYYGPHGRRVITENVMEILKTELKNCTDAVVQASGIAAFVQAVMVPEAAVLLIMEDCGVAWAEAESIRGKTYEMGLLLNEEIEDEVERRPEDDSDAENEYRHG